MSTGTTTIYDRLFLLMIKHGKSRNDLVKDIGISASNISDWGKGKSRPNVDVLIRLADYFNVSIDYLAGRESMYPDPSPDSCTLMKAFSELDEEGKTIVLAAAFTQRQRCKNIGGNENENGNGQSC